MMSADEIYERWRKARGGGQVPDDFADRVMAAVELQQRHARETVLRGLLVAIARSRLARVGICSVAGALCLVRIGCVVSTFVVF